MKMILYQQVVEKGEKFRSVINSNDDLAKKITDVKLEETVKVEMAGEEVFHLVSASDKGCLVYSIQKRNSRLGDYTAYILGVPLEILPSASCDMANIISMMDNLHADRDSFEKLKPLFNKDYKACEVVLDWTFHGHKHNYACRVVDEQQRDVLLGKGILVREYTEYEGIYVVTKRQIGMLHLENMTDLSHLKVADNAIVRPPLLPKGVLADFFLDGKVLKLPVMRSVGDEIDLLVKRSNYADITLNFVVSSHDFTPSLPVGMRWVRVVPANAFRVCCGEDAASSFNIMDVATVQGAEKDRGRDCFLVPEELEGNATVRACLDGCNDKVMENVDLTGHDADNPLEIELEKLPSSHPVRPQKPKAKDIKTSTDHEGLSVNDGTGANAPGNANAKVVGANGTDADTASMMEEDVPTCPGSPSSTSQVIDTPSFDDKEDDNPMADEAMEAPLPQPFFTPERMRGQMEGLLAGMLIALFPAWLLFAWRGENDGGKPSEQMQWQEEQPATATGDSPGNEVVMEYLDTATQWRKTEMDTVFYNHLFGMYDSLNHFNLKFVLDKARFLKISDCRPVVRIDSAWMELQEDSISNAYTGAPWQKGKKAKRMYSNDGTITLDSFFDYLHKIQMMNSDGEKEKDDVTDIEEGDDGDKKGGSEQ